MKQDNWNNCELLFHQFLFYNYSTFLIIYKKLSLKEYSKLYPIYSSFILSMNKKVFFCWHKNIKKTYNIFVKCQKNQVI